MIADKVKNRALPIGSPIENRPSRHQRSVITFRAARNSATRTTNATTNDETNEIYCIFPFPLFSLPRPRTISPRPPRSLTWRETTRSQREGAQRKKKKTKKKKRKGKTRITIACNIYTEPSLSLTKRKRKKRIPDTTRTEDTTNLAGRSGCGRPADPGKNESKNR